MSTPGRDAVLGIASRVYVEARELVYSFLVAATFLTRVRVPHPSGIADTPPRWTLLFFPVVGLIVGYAAILVFTLASRILSPIVAATITVAFTAMATGALHEDGLADSADGFGGGWNRDQILTIMRDSRIGSFGSLALFLAMLLKVGALATSRPESTSAMLLSGHVLARWSSLPLMLVLPYVRSDGGSASAFSLFATPGVVVAGSVIGAASLVTLGLHTVVIASVSAIAIAITSGLYYARRISGYTGDCLGATNQLVECAVFVALAAQW